MSLLPILPWIACGMAMLPLALVISNLSALHRLPAGRSRRSVSILIPARNEARNIGQAIASILENPDTDLEILVLDDDSSDSTALITRDWSARDRRVRLLSGSAHDPSLWGKPQACARLADAARGEYLLFMDADVRLKPDAVSRICAALDGSATAMLSGIPQQRTQTLAEKLVVPLIHFILLGFLPIRMMRNNIHPGFGVACGQLLAVRREAYFAAGGHGAIADRVHDGMALAHSLRRAGYMTDLADFTDLASCRMYGTANEVVAGFAKNAHEGLGSPQGILPWSMLLFGGQCAWIALLPAAAAGLVPIVPAALAAVCAYAARIPVDRRFRTLSIGTILHPLGITVLIAIQWYALARRLAGRPVAWKARIPEAAGPSVGSPNPTP